MCPKSQLQRLNISTHRQPNNGLPPDPRHASSHQSPSYGRADDARVGRLRRKVRWLNLERSSTSGSAVSRAGCGYRSKLFTSTATVIRSWSQVRNRIMRRDSLNQVMSSGVNSTHFTRTKLAWWLARDVTARRRHRATMFRLNPSVHSHTQPNDGLHPTANSAALKLSHPARRVMPVEVKLLWKLS